MIEYKHVSQQMLHLCLSYACFAYSAGDEPQGLVDARRPLDLWAMYKHLFWVENKYIIKLNIYGRNGEDALLSYI